MCEQQLYPEDYFSFNVHVYANLHTLGFSNAGDVQASPPGYFHNIAASVWYLPFT